MRYTPTSEGGGGGAFQFNGGTDIIQYNDVSESGPDPFTRYLSLQLSSTLVPTSNWNTDSSGVWSHPANWTPTSVPNASNASAVFGPAISAPSQITVDVPTNVGFLTFNSPNSYTLAGPGPLTIHSVGTAATLNLVAGSHEIATPLILDGNATISANSAVSTLTISSPISGSSALIMAGPGTLNLTASNSYAGGTYLGSGILRISSDFNLGAPAASLYTSGGTLQPAANLLLNRNVSLTANTTTIDTNSFDSTLAGNLTGPGSITKIGSGTLTLSGTNSYTGLTTVDNGTLLFQTLSNISPNSQILINPNGVVALSTGSLNPDFYKHFYLFVDPFQNTKLSTGTLGLTQADANGTIDFDQLWFSRAAALTVGAVGTVTFNGAITSNHGYRFGGGGGGTLILANPNVLNIPNSPLTIAHGGTVVLASSNSFTGSITVDSSTLSIPSNASIGGNAIFSDVITLAHAGTLQFTSSFTLSNHRFILENGGGIFDTGNNTNVITHNIDGSGSLTKIGGGTLVLTAANTYTGPTNINAGTLIVTPSGSIASSSAINLNGGTLLNEGFVDSSLDVSPGSTLQGSGTYSGSVSLDSGSTIAFVPPSDLSDPDASSTHVVDQLMLDPSPTSLITIRVTSISEASFDSTQPYVWTLVRTDAGIQNFSTDMFSIDVSALSLGNFVTASAFAVEQDGNNLVLTFTPPDDTPEPAAGLLVPVGLLYLPRRCRRRLRLREAATMTLPSPNSVKLAGSGTAPACPPSNA